MKNSENQFIIHGLLERSFEYKPKQNNSKQTESWAQEGGGHKVEDGTDRNKRLLSLISDGL